MEVQDDSKDDLKDDLKDDVWSEELPEGAQEKDRQLSQEISGFLLKRSGTSITNNDPPCLLHYEEIVNSD